MSYIAPPEPADEPAPIWPAALMMLAAAGALVAIVALAAIYGA